MLRRLRACVRAYVPAGLRIYSVPKWWIWNYGSIHRGYDMIERMHACRPRATSSYSCMCRAVWRLPHATVTSPYSTSSSSCPACRPNVSTHAWYLIPNQNSCQDTAHNSGVKVIHEFGNFLDPCENREEGYNWHSCNRNGLTPLHVEFFLAADASL